MKRLFKDSEKRQLDAIKFRIQILNFIGEFVSGSELISITNDLEEDMKVEALKCIGKLSKKNDETVINTLIIQYQNSDK